MNEKLKLRIKEKEDNKGKITYGSIVVKKKVVKELEQEVNQRKSKKE